MTAPLLLPLRRIGLWRRGEIEIALRSDGAWLSRHVTGDWILVATRLDEARVGIDAAGVIAQLARVGYVRVEGRACPA